MLLSCMSKYESDLSRIFQALGDPTRRALLARIKTDAVPVTVLAGPTGFALPTVMRHLAVLEEAGLIETEKRGRTRLCRSRPETLTVALDWLSEQRVEWDARLDRLDAYVMKLQKEAEDDSGP